MVVELVTPASAVSMTEAPSKRPSSPSDETHPSPVKRPRRDRTPEHPPQRQNVNDGDNNAYSSQGSPQLVRQATIERIVSTTTTLEQPPNNMPDVTVAAEEVQRRCATIVGGMAEMQAGLETMDHTLDRVDAKVDGIAWMMEDLVRMREVRERRDRVDRIEERVD